MPKMLVLCIMHFSRMKILMICTFRGFFAKEDCTFCASVADQTKEISALRNFSWRCNKPFVQLFGGTKPVSLHIFGRQKVANHILLYECPLVVFVAIKHKALDANSSRPSVLLTKSFLAIYKDFAKSEIIALYTSFSANPYEPCLNLLCRDIKLKSFQFSIISPNLHPLLPVN